MSGVVKMKLNSKKNDALCNKYASFNLWYILSYLASCNLLSLIWRLIEKTFSFKEYLNLLGIFGNFTFAKYQIYN